jgi:transcriptional antiterminator RfaH
MKKENFPPSTHWYLIYTKPRAEKKVANLLKCKDIEVFLPLQKTLRQWSDRKKWVEEPLFKSYIFLRTNLERNYYQILNVDGVVKFVSFHGSPAKVDEREISLVKLLLGNQEEMVESGVLNEVFHLGEEVTITAGPLIGIKGKLVATRSGNKMLIELETMNQNLLITLPSNSLIKARQTA